MANEPKNVSTGLAVVVVALALAVVAVLGWVFLRPKPVPPMKSPPPEVLQDVFKKAGMKVPPADQLKNVFPK